MLNLTANDRLDADAIEAVADAGAITAALPAATGAEAGALAIAAGRLKAADAITALVGKLAEDGIAGLAAAWALGQLDAEAAVRAAIPEGRIDTRQNGYHALAAIAARGGASAGLTDWLRQRIPVELEKAKSGGTGLADHVVKTLAVLGATDIAALVQTVIEGDRFCDRFELDRLRSAVADHGRDRDAIRDLTAPWRTIFADHLIKEAVPEVAKPVPAAKAPAAKAPAPAAKAPAPAAKAPPAPQAPLPPADDEAELMDAGEGAEGMPPEGAVAQVDWPAFSTSPEFTALAPQAQGLISQLGPVLEQIAAQAIRAAFTDLSGQELAALLLQVLPQALQPQQVQMALHPHALNGYQALAKFLHRTGAATQGDSLVQGVKLVRKQLQAQMRRAGMIGGPDYSDPDEQAAPAT